MKLVDSRISPSAKKVETNKAIGFLCLIFLQIQHSEVMLSSISVFLHPTPSVWGLEGFKLLPQISLYSLYFICFYSPCKTFLTVSFMFHQNKVHWWFGLFSWENSGYTHISTDLFTACERQHLLMYIAADYLFVRVVYKWVTHILVWGSRTIVTHSVIYKFWVRRSSRWQTHPWLLLLLLLMLLLLTKFFHGIIFH